MQQGQYVLYPRNWTRVGFTFQQEDLKPKDLSQMEMEMVLFLSNSAPWAGELIRSSLHWQGQFRPIQAKKWSVDFAAINSRTIFELDG